MEFINDIFDEFARAFAGQMTFPQEIAEPNRLDRTRLDFSLASLDAVDQYLRVLHHRYAAGKLDGQSGTRTVLRGGAYLGELIRRNSDEEWNWVDQDEYLAFHSDVPDVFRKKSNGTRAFLHRPGGEILLPLNRIERFFADGMAMSTAYFAPLGRLRKPS